jgi:hypothetical protein
MVIFPIYSDDRPINAEGDLKDLGPQVLSQRAQIRGVCWSVLAFTYLADRWHHRYQLRTNLY